MVQRRKGGRIVAISSVAGLAGHRGQVNYSATKAGIIGAAKALAVELAKRNISVNCVAPGNNIRSSGTDQYGEGPLELARKATPMKRLGQVDEVARVILFLASDRNDFVTGSILRVDGGQALWGDIWPIAEEPAEGA
jgi:citronellol/citronellal dehydrogenase